MKSIWIIFGLNDIYRTIVAFYLTPFSARVGHGLVERLPRSRKEGLGVGWLRGWVKGLGLSSSESHTV